MKKAALLIALSVLASLAAPPAPLEFLSAEFTTKKSKRSDSSTVQGTLFYTRSRTIVKVVSPVSQYMIIDSAATTIYNVNEQTAFRIRSRNPAALPLFRLFIGFFQSRRIALPSDFLVKTARTVKDTIYVTWESVAKKRVFKGRFETAYVDNRPVSVMAYARQGERLSAVWFSRDTLLSGTPVPLDMRSWVALRSDTLTERISFRNVTIGQETPPAIRDFLIPPSITVRELSW